MTDLLNEQIALNKRMNDAVADVLRQHNGLIRTDEDWYKDTIYCYIFDEALETTTENKVLAVALFDGEVCVLPASSNESLDGMTDDEVLNDDGWYSIFGGMCCVSPTLYCLCESIEQYL
jgi:hypothetical protein